MDYKYNGILITLMHYGNSYFEKYQVKAKQDSKHTGRGGVNRQQARGPHAYTEFPRILVRMRFSPSAMGPVLGPGHRKGPQETS